MLDDPKKRQLTSTSIYKTITDTPSLPVVVVGIVTRFNALTYMAYVAIPYYVDELECLCASPFLSTYPPAFGASVSIAYPEGASVLVLWQTATSGVIIGAIPSLVPAEDSIVNNSLQTRITYDTAIAGAEDTSLAEYTTSLAGNFRPTDLVAGDITTLNEFGIGTGVLKFQTFMQASDRAKLQMGLFNDQVKLTSGLYQHINSAGWLTIYNDEGFNTQEFLGSHHQCEMMGRKEYGREYLKEAGEDSKYDTNLEPADDISTYPLARYQGFLGHLGNLFNFFISNPSKEEKEPDEGFFHTSIDGSGRTLVQSAGGITLQRTDKISIPKKKAQPWLEVDKPDELTEIEPFKWNEDYTHARYLQLRDAFAYYVRNSYVRLIESGCYTVPEVKELKALTDKFDELKGTDKDATLAEGDFNSEHHKDASSFIHLGEDGSIVLRGKCGEEIIMSGGNITFNCPGNVEIKTGSSVVVLGGDDVVLKAKNSVDVSATDKDVRIKAQKNLHAYSANGILLESASSGEEQNFKESGEGVVSSGIILKAPKSRIFAWGNKIHMAFKEMGVIEALKQVATATLDFLVPNFRVFSESGGDISLKSGKSLLNLTSGSALLASSSAYVSGSASGAVFSGSKTAEMDQDAPPGMNPHPTIEPALQKDEDEVLGKKKDGKEHLGAVYYANETARDQLKFTFRGVRDYGTDKGSEVFKEEGFRVYAPFWQFLKEQKYQFIEGVTEKWAEEEVNGTYPWPGKDYYTGSTGLIKLVSEKNIVANLPKKWLDDDAIVNESGEFKEVGMGELAILKKG